MPLLPIAYTITILVPSISIGILEPDHQTPENLPSRSYMKINCRSWASIDLNPNGKGKRKLEGRENAEKEKYMAMPTTYVFPIHFTMNTHILFTSVCCGRDTNTLLLHFAIQHFQPVRRSQKASCPHW